MTQITANDLPPVGTATQQTIDDFNSEAIYLPTSPATTPSVSNGLLKTVNKLIIPCFISAIALTHVGISKAQVVIDEKTGLLAHEMKVIQTTLSAKVVIVPYTSSFESALTEADLKLVGCIFVTRDRSRITSLIDILEHAHLSTLDGFDMALIQEPRQGIYLTLADGSEAKFLFRKPYIDIDQTQGTFTHPPNVATMRVASDRSLPRSLTLWAAETTPPVNENPGRARGCEEFITFITKTRDSK